MGLEKLLRKWLNTPTDEEVREMHLKMQSDSVHDFERVIYTLSSSIHEAHIETAEKMFSAFKVKWGDLPRGIMEYNDVIFNRERQKVLDKFRALDYAYESKLELPKGKFNKRNVELLMA